MNIDALACDKPCLCPEVRLTDMRLEPSHDGHHMLIWCRCRIVAIVGSMGSSVEIFDFADVGRLTAMELIERL